MRDIGWAHSGTDPCFLSWVTCAKFKVDSSHMREVTEKTWFCLQQIDGQYCSHPMMTSSNGNFFRVTGHLCGEFTGPRWIPRTKASDASFDVFFDLRLNKRLSKQSSGWWFETLSHPLWRHCNAHPHPYPHFSEDVLYPQLYFRIRNSIGTFLINYTK